MEEQESEKEEQKKCICKHNNYRQIEGGRKGGQG